MKLQIEKAHCSMRFSIVIPTQNRSELLDVVLTYATKIDYPDYELIISDNSTSSNAREMNLQVFEKHQTGSTLSMKLVSPQNVLAVPKHFEFALHHAKGDYVGFLTDKMIVLPDLLNATARVINSGDDVDIVNYLYHSYVVDDYTQPGGSGKLILSKSLPSPVAYEINPIDELKKKSSGGISRSNQTKLSYLTGKICFGFYSIKLINQIIRNTGELFGGVTHDYSSMVQGLILARRVLVLRTPMMIFISLPSDKSLGMLTALNSSAALNYYSSFDDSDNIINSLPVPGLYSSQHNMVASDYKRYLELYGKEDMFEFKNWAVSMYNDIFCEGRVWSTLDEELHQKDLIERLVPNGERTEYISIESNKKSKFGGIRQKLISSFELLPFVLYILNQIRNFRSEKFLFKTTDLAVKYVIKYKKNWPGTIR
jgi:hypothetical protein